MSSKKRRAFTLTELLVVVVIIGVLSAVVLPKFTKVLETRKTTEAEAMMVAVRNEQESRCSISKRYRADLSQLASLNNQADTKNYKYEDFEGVGVQASAKGSYAYNLRMPSYVDGRICCDGKDCEKLNKDYPTCDELKAKGDYVAGNAQCEAEPVPTPSACEENETRIDNSKCGNESGYKCVGGEWISFNNTIELTADEIQTCKCDVRPSNETEACPDGTTRTKKYECNSATGKYEPGEWDRECQSTGTTCGDWTNPEFGGPATADDICTQKVDDEGNSGVFMVDMDKPIAADATAEEVESICCTLCAEGEEMTSAGICCPKGTPGIYDSATGKSWCGDCSAKGPNYYYNGKDCVKRYTMQPASFTAVLGTVYQDFQPIFDGCSFDFTGVTVPQCSSSVTRNEDGSMTQTATSPKEDLCDQCDANSLDCNVVACYDYGDYQTQLAKYENGRNNINYSKGRGGVCSGTATAEIPTWYSVIGVASGEPTEGLLCGSFFKNSLASEYSLNTAEGAIWLSDIGGIPQVSCQKCGGKSQQVSLSFHFTNTQSMGDGPCSYGGVSASDPTQNYTIQQIADEDYKNMLFGPGGYNPDWDTVKHIVEIRTGTIPPAITKDNQYDVYQQINWKEVYGGDIAAFLRDMGVDNMEAVTNGQMMAALRAFGYYAAPEYDEPLSTWYEKQFGSGGGIVVNGKNKQNLQASFADNPALSATDYIMAFAREITADADKNWQWDGWGNWLNDQGMLPDNYDNLRHNVAQCMGSGMNLCAAPAAIPVKGYACSRR